jgi:hypothetical protein
MIRATPPKSVNPTAVDKVLDPGTHSGVDTVWDGG